jgi:hypothetical protein
MADQLVRTGSEQSFTGPEPACDISTGVAKKAVRDWMNRNCKKHTEAIMGLKQAKGLTPGPSSRRTKDLLKLNRDQLTHWGPEAQLCAFIVQQQWTGGINLCF